MVTAFLAGFVLVMLTSLQTVLLAKRRVLHVFIVGFTISAVWALAVKTIASSLSSVWAIYALGAACGSVVGCLVGHAPTTSESRRRDT